MSLATCPPSAGYLRESGVNLPRICLKRNPNSREIPCRKGIPIKDFPLSRRSFGFCRHGCSSPVRCPSRQVFPEGQLQPPLPANPFTGNRRAAPHPQGEPELGAFPQEGKLCDLAHCGAGGPYNPSADRGWGATRSRGKPSRPAGLHPYGGRGGSSGDNSWTANPLFFWGRPGKVCWPGTRLRRPTPFVHSLRRALPRHKEKAAGQRSGPEPAENWGGLPGVVNLGRSDKRGALLNPQGSRAAGLGTVDECGGRRQRGIWASFPRGKPVRWAGIWGRVVTPLEAGKSR